MFTSRRIATIGGDKFRDEFSLAFDGINDYIQTAGKPVDTADATYVFWMKASETGDNRVVFSHGDANIGGFAVNHHTKSKPLLYLNSSLYQYWNDAPAQDDGKWHHWAVVVDIDDMTACKLYVDGVLQTQGDRSTSGTASSYQDLRIARGDSEYWEGSMSEFAVYNVMLSASQVKTLYNGREPYNHNEGILTGNLKAWYRMGDGILDHKATTDGQGGIVCDMTNATLGNDIFGGRGNFTDNSDSYWSFGGAGASNGVIEDGVCKFNPSGSSNCSLQKAGMLTIGQMYRLDIDVTSVDSTQAAGTSLVIDDNNPYVRVSELTDGITSHTMYWRPINNTAFILYRYNIHTDGVAYDEAIQFDNLKVRPVNGNPGYMSNMIPDNFERDTP